MTRAERMQGHLLAQFANKPIFYAILDAFGAELDEVSKAFTDLKEKRWIDTGEGAQLDGIGQIVNQPRQIKDAIPLSFFGFDGQDNALGFDVGRFRDSWEAWLHTTTLSDPEYRKILWLKIFKDVSNGTAEDTIASIKRIFDASYVPLVEVGNAKIALGVGRFLTTNELALARSVDLVVKAGGVGVLWINHFDYNNYFGFSDQQNAKGFDIGHFADAITIL